MAADRGIQFLQGYGGKRPLTILEATGSGCAFFDDDSDGWLDLFLAGQPRCALYHNRGGGSLVDVTQAAGVGRDGFWIGCATGDYDNDGDTDLFVTGYNTCALYQNDGHGAFKDVTGTAGIRDHAYQTSAGFADVDRDGFLDLYICHYVRFGPDEPQYCPSADPKLLRTCGPDAYLAQVGVFYHNRGDGTFIEATKQFGMATAHGKAWGVAFGDYDRDGWPDCYVANDEMPCDLFHNTGGGRMQNVGAVTGTAYSADGSLQGGMGADFGDYDNDGWPDLIVTNFWMQPNALYRNEGAAAGKGGPWLFTEVSQAAGLLQATLKRVGFGTRFFDADNDGWLDLYFLNGHVQDTHPIDPEQGMPEQMQLFLSERNGRFREASAEAGEPFQRKVVGRGAAFGDFDNDGRLDIAAMDMEGPALLLRNEGPGDPARRGHWLMVRALCRRTTNDEPRIPIRARKTTNDHVWRGVVPSGLDSPHRQAEGPPALVRRSSSYAPESGCAVRRSSYRDAIGARVTITAGGQQQVREVQTSGSVLAANDPRAHFGLGTATRVDRLSIRWPDGTIETLSGVAADQILTIRQGESRGG